MKNILFCGTPHFATASLEAIYKYQKELSYKLSGVVTIQDKTSGRGQKKQESDVKKLGKKLNLKIFTPTELNDTTFIEKITKLNLDLIIVVAFKKLPEILFKIPKHGTINLHASLLPKYRGAAPINWAIINGEKETGLTTFYINDKIDTGDIIHQTKVKIKPNWHLDELYSVLMEESDQIIYQTIKSVFNNTSNRKKQQETSEIHNKYARKIKKSDFKLDSDFWKLKTIKEMYDFIRGMSPPGVKTTIKINQKQTMKIIITKVNNFHEKGDSLSKKNYKDIQIKFLNKENLIITNGAQIFNIEKIKTENGKEITAQEFYNGFIRNKRGENTLNIVY